jgi:hypothetical protein
MLHMRRKTLICLEAGIYRSNRSLNLQTFDAMFACWFRTTPVFMLMCYMTEQTFSVQRDEKQLQFILRLFQNSLSSALINELHVAESFLRI